MSFYYTPALLAWMRAHCQALNVHDMAKHLGCAAGTLAAICVAHGIVLCKSSDPDAELMPVPIPSWAAPPLVPTSAVRAPASSRKDG